MKAPKDRREDFHDPERKDNYLGRNKTRLELWEEHFKYPIVALDKSFEVRGEFVLRLTIGSETCCGIGLEWLVACGGLRHGSKCVGQTFMGISLASLGPLGQCAFAHSIHALECPEEVWTAR